MLRKKIKRKNIGLFIDEVENSVSNAICRGAMRAAADNNVNLFIFPSGILAKSEFFEKNDVETGRRGERQFNVLFSMANGFNLDAVILPVDNICIDADNESKELLLSKLSGIPTLVIGEYGDYANVHFSNATGIKEAVDFLVNEKHVERIAYLSGPRNNFDSEQRLTAYEDAMVDHGLKINSDYIEFGSFTTNCEKEIEQLFDRANDMQALICASDMMAKIAYLEASFRGRAIGQDLFIVGYDDMEDCMSMNPHLSSVRADHELIGFEAVNAALEEGYIAQKKSRSIETKFIARESAGEKTNGKSDIVMRIATMSGDLDDMNGLCELLCEYSFEEEPRDYQGSCQKTVLQGFFDRLISHFFQNVVKRNSEDEIYAYFDSMVERGLLEYVSARRLTDIFDVIYQAFCGRTRVLTNRMVLHALISRMEHKVMEWATENKDRQESRFEEMLHLTNDITRDILYFDDEAEKNYESALKKMWSLGIPYSVLLVYDNPYESTEPIKFNPPYSVLVKATQSRNTVTHIPRTSQRTLFNEIHSHDALNDGVRHSFIVCDLYSMNEQLGLFLYDVNESTLIYREFLTYQLSSAVKIIKLFHQQMVALRAYENIVEKIQHENAELLEASTVDSLTSILNRRGFFEEAEDLKLHRVGSDGVFIAAFADLDYLKTINDTYGHEEGDFAIRSAANILYETFGEFAIVGRIGGDEFAAFMYQSRRNQSERIQERLNVLLDKFNKESGKPYELSISLGILEFDAIVSRDLDAMLGEVDDMLYEQKRAKHSGENFFPFARSRVRIPQ